MAGAFLTGFNASFSKRVASSIIFPMHPATVSYHATCIGVEPPFWSCYWVLTHGLFFPKTLAGYPFICELCTIRTNIGPTPLLSGVMNALMMLERMQLIDTAHSWAPKRLTGYPRRSMVLPPVLQPVLNPDGSHAAPP
jgi:hypothetical protein